MSKLRIELVNILPIFQINLTYSFDTTSSVVEVVQLCKLCLKIDHFARYVYNHICKYPKKSYQHQKLVFILTFNVGSSEICEKIKSNNPFLRYIQLILFEIDCAIWL